MNAILIFDPDAELHITAARYAEWRLHADGGGVIIWNRAGAVGVVSNAVLSNVIREYESQETLLRTIDNYAIPPWGRKITWDQVTLAKDDRPRPVRV